jgi:hypothetical protein
MDTAVSQQKSANAPTRRFARVLAIVLALIAVVSLAWAKKEFMMPRAESAKNFPARDEHPSEKVTVAADPYDSGAKLDVFIGKYTEHGLMPVMLVITNDGDEPISLTSMKIEMLTRFKSKVPPATVDDIERRMTGNFKRPDATRPYPLPFPRKAKSALSADIRDEIDRAMFSAHAVDAHATQHAFVFFDFSDLQDPLAGARLFVSGVRTGEGQELWFFEIPMEKYLSAPR